MSLNLTGIPVPLRPDGRGGYRVGDTRVSLDIVIREFKEGADLESVVRGYPSLQLADVLVVIAYYLRNRQEVEEYLETRRVEAENLRQAFESGQTERKEFREKLLARQKESERAHAAPGD
jgi:uncharacterized protein (DUF433 family)